jgi:hypothetical protein
MVAMLWQLCYGSKSNTYSHKFGSTEILTLILLYIIKVTSAGRAGQQLDISTKIRAPSGKLVVYSNRKVEDQLLGYEIQEQGDYEICFNNRYSMLEHKRIFWQFEIEGAFDVAKAEEKLLNATMEFYNEASNQVQKVVRKVCRFSLSIQLNLIEKCLPAVLLSNVLCALQSWEDLHNSILHFMNGDQTNN